MKSFITHVPIFNLSVLTVIDCTKSEAEEFVYDYESCRSKVSFENGTCGGVRIDRGDVFMWVKDSNRASIVFHELVHVAFAILEIKGIGSDEELIAYLVEWLKINIVDVIYDLPN